MSKHSLLFILVIVIIISFLYYDLNLRKNKFEKLEQEEEEKDTELAELELRHVPEEMESNNEIKLREIHFLLIYTSSLPSQSQIYLLPISSLNTY